MTVRSTIETIRALSPLFSVRHSAGEYRVSFSPHTISGLMPDWSYAQCAEQAESMAYYTDDADDAVGTAKHMLDAYKAGFAALA